MERSTVRLAFDRQQLLRARLRHLRSTFLNSAWSVDGFCLFRGREIIADRVGNDEITVGQALHQRAGAEAVRAVIGEVRFAQDETGPGSVLIRL